MKPTKFIELADRHGTTEHYTAGQVFHAQDFPNRLFLLKKGYVKRYQASDPDNKVIELIYGPGYIISLSQLYKRLFGVSQNQEDLIYIYQAMTDVEMQTIDGDLVIEELERNPGLHADFFFASGLILRSNITRLASNAIKDDYKKVAHLLMSLAYEFAELSEGDTNKSIALPLPESAEDMAEQLNISKEVAEAVLSSLENGKIISRKSSDITILNIDLLKDVYL